jgi:hypothetical protein
MQEEYDRFKVSDFSHKDVLDKEMNALFIWGVRRWDRVQNPDFCEKDKLIVFDDGDGPCERIEMVKAWPLEEFNHDFCQELDSRIIDTYRKLKGAGIHRPSIIAPYCYLDELYSRDNEEMVYESPKKWASASLVWHRLNSTGRLATRYDQFDRFGPVRIYKKKHIELCFDRKVLRPEMVRRGLLSG